MQTYFISDGFRVKIGRSSNPQNRLAILQTGHPHELKMLLVLAEDREDELHQQFARYRIRGEWFRLSFAILEFIAEHNQKEVLQPFYAWLMEQRQRCDDLGRLANIVASDAAFPKEARQLWILLKHYDEIPRLRGILKYAHRKWRRSCFQHLSCKRFDEIMRAEASA